MLQPTDDLRIAALRPLLPPAILMEEEFPLTEDAANTVVQTRLQAADILHGRDDRLLVVVGPCSIHDTKAALEYGNLLREISKRFSADLCLIMRVYFEKPRTTVGWKGLINDPHLDGTFDINQGLRLARNLLLSLANQGIAAGTEFLDTITPQFIADLVAWGAIGARTTESQIHRELASGLSMPVGLKNGTDGNIQITLDAIQAARHPHHFLSVTKQGIAAIVATHGNVDCHVILRGSTAGTNFDATTISNVAADLNAADVPASIMIDCSHGNSSKDHTRQPLVAYEAASQIAAGQSYIRGIMLESHLYEGRQNYQVGQPLQYGQSITDACISWEMTVPVLEKLAQAVQQRRNT